MYKGGSTKAHVMVEHAAGGTKPKSTGATKPTGTTKPAGGKPKPAVNACDGRSKNPAVRQACINAWAVKASGAKCAKASGAALQVRG